MSKFLFPWEEAEDVPMDTAAAEVKIVHATERLKAAVPDNLKPEEMETVNVSDAIVFTKRAFLGTTTTLGDIVKTTDVVSSVYEGGFKLWECALDVIVYLSESKVPLKGMRVADVGCGHGLPGIFCLQQGAQHVAFQDLNAEVLSNCTMTNVAANTDIKYENAAAAQRVSFCAGDWASDDLAALMNQCASGSSSMPSTGVFDLILTSDTLYSSTSIPRLIGMLKRLLRRPSPSSSSDSSPSSSSSSGVAFVAAKRYYFGVGGSVAEFMDLIARDRSSEQLQAEVVKVFEDKMSNIREIVKVTWKSQS